MPKTRTFWLSRSYLTIKKRMLGVDTLRYYDLYAPTVKNINLKYSYEEAQKLVAEALAPLGSELLNAVELFDPKPEAKEDKPLVLID